MTPVERIRALADSYRADASNIKHMPQQIGYGLTNDDWVILYRTVGSELDNAADLIEPGDS